MWRIHIFIIVAVLFAVFLWQITPPFSFPSGSIITVAEGLGLYTLAEKLQEDKVVRSSFWFRIAAIMLGGERAMKAGQYQMSGPQNTFVIAWRVFHGDHDIETVKITIPEGFTIHKIAALFDERFSFFNQAEFLASAPEGYLFPDTYFIPVVATASSTILLFKNNFDRKISDLSGEIEASGHSVDEIVKMASIIESEVKLKADKEIASGILWKRLKLDMPLQVDSDPDTYKHLGFPPRPISNPGLESIETAIYPTTTPYLYFLTGDDGTMHYANTFDGHKENITTYLKP